MYFLTPAINTNLVPKQDAAAARARDLLDPMEGQDGVEHGGGGRRGGLAVGAVLRQMGEDDGMAFLKALSKQDIVNLDATNRHSGSGDPGRVRRSRSTSSITTRC